jgi:hypothetical protein
MRIISGFPSRNQYKNIEQPEKKAAMIDGAHDPWLQ